MSKDFIYKFNEGPLVSEKELSGEWNIGNCRRAVQYYLWFEKKLFLAPQQILCPAAYRETGSFVTGNGQKFSFNLLEKGDIIYAEKIRGKNGENLDKGEKNFNTNDKYIISLHTALFTKKTGEEIWHATAIEGKSCFWSLEKFLHYYRPIAAKRV